MNQTEDMNVKKLNNLGRTLLVLRVVAILMAVILPAIAGSVGDRAILTTAGATKTWTNPHDVSAVLLKRIWVQDSQIAGNTVTVTRVTGHRYGSYTQAVGTVVCASGAGSTAELTAAYLLPDEVLVLTGLGVTNYVGLIDYEVQQH